MNLITSEGYTMIDTDNIVTLHRAERTRASAVQQLIDSSVTQFQARNDLHRRACAVERPPQKSTMDCVIVCLAFFAGISLGVALFALLCIGIGHLYQYLTHFDWSQLYVSKS
jgi:hypothetical protein